MPEHALGPCCCDGGGIMSLMESILRVWFSGRDRHGVVVRIE